MFFASCGNITVEWLFQILKLLLSFRLCQTRKVEDWPIADRALEVWSFIKKSNLSKSKKPKNSSFECLVSNNTDALIRCKLHFFPILCPYLRTIWLFSKVMLLWSYFCLMPFSQIVGPNLQKGFNGCLWSTSKMLKKDWLMDKVNLQDLSKIDVGEGAQTAWKELNLSPEKTR